MCIKIAMIIINSSYDITKLILHFFLPQINYSLPEAVSSVIVTNQGHGAMGISSSISSNTFDILLCLGIPWFVKAYYVPDVAGENWVN